MRITGCVCYNRVCRASSPGTVFTGGQSVRGFMSAGAARGKVMLVPASVTVNNSACRLPRGDQSVSGCGGSGGGSSCTRCCSTACTSGSERARKWGRSSPCSASALSHRWCSSSRMVSAPARLPQTICRQGGRPGGAWLGPCRGGGKRLGSAAGRPLLSLPREAEACAG